MIKTEQLIIPQNLFDELDTEFHFSNYYIKSFDELNDKRGGVYLCVPPKGPHQVGKWVEKA